jgi:hypothetical protein
MEIKTSANQRREMDSFFGSFGRGIQTMIQAPLFIIVGIIVAVWEGVNKVLQTISTQGAHYGSALGGAGLTGTSTNIKVPILPIDNYSRLDVDEVVSRLEGLSVTELGVVKIFESSHENRAPILVAIDKRLAEMH